MTRRILLSIAALAFLASARVDAQVQYSVGNWLRYGNGSQYVAQQRDRKEYIENQANVRLFWNDFTVGFQYIYDDPPEFGPRYQGVKKRYVEFAREGIELRAGDFWTLYGKGLAVNLFENRGINYDTGLDGLRGTYRSEYLSAIIATGTMKYYDLIDPTRYETYSVRSGNVEVAPLHGLRLGASIVGADGLLPDAFGNSDVHADILEAMVSGRLAGFELFGNYATKRSTGLRPTGPTSLESFNSTGEAIYGSLSYTSDIGLGITAEYKNYTFDVVDPERRDRNRPTRMLPMQNPPIVHKEHAFTLLTRAPHTIDFNDEVGWQLDVFYSVSPTLTINANAAVASRTKSWAKLPSGSIKPILRSNSLFPALDAEFSPFWEAYVEAEWYFDGQSYLRAAVNRRYDAPFEEISRTPHVVASTTVPLRIEYMLDEEYSLGISLEQQVLHDTYIPAKQSYFLFNNNYNEYVSITVTKSPQWAASFRTEFTDDPTDPSGKKFWAAGEFSYRIAQVHTATVTLGTERGGLVCSNGVCRVVNPFEGIRFALLTQL